MFSMLLELSTNCNSCGNPLPINAFTEKVFCNKCNKDNVLSADLWKSLLEELLGEVVTFQDSEGRPSKVMTGQYNFDMLYGRKNARCNKCKTDIPEEELDKFTESGKYNCKKCGAGVFVRQATELLQSIYPSAKYIVSEDENMLKGSSEKPEEKNSAKPVLFTCPSCAGNLEIDGKERIIECTFCKSKVYLPDDLWFSLHPVVSKERWYITFDNKLLSESMPEWSSLYDAVIDEEGNVYVASTMDTFDKELTVWSYSPDMKKRWAINNLNLEKENSHIAVSRKGELYVWNKNGRSLTVLSTKDGSVLRKIKGEQKTKDNPYTFTVENCEAMISDTDGTLLALIKSTFVRFNPDGTRTSLWGSAAENESKGFFSRLFSGSDDKIDIPDSDPDDTPKLDKLEDKPRTLDSYYIRMFSGWDNCLYIYKEDYDVIRVAKYTRSGEMEWNTSFKFGETGKKISADSKGNVYIVGTDEDKKSKLMRLSPDAKNFDVVLKDISEGGNFVFDSDDMVLVSPDGVINIINTNGQLRVFNPDYSVKFISNTLKEDDADYREELSRNN